MDSELKSYLDEMRSDLKGQIGGLRDELKAHTERSINGLRDELRTHIDRRLDILRTELMAHTEKVETNLLSEFWKWARTSDIRARQTGSILNAHSINAIAVDERMMAIEERVSEIERRRAS
jgi:hypothetical protein